MGCSYADQKHSNRTKKHQKPKKKKQKRVRIDKSQKKKVLPGETFENRAEVVGRSMANLMLSSTVFVAGVKKKKKLDICQEV